MTNDPVLALAEKWRKELEDHIVKSTEAPDVATCIEELESILPQRDAERDAATRIAALEQAEEIIRKWNFMACSDADGLRDEILALRTQSDLDWLKRHDAQMRLEEAESWHERVLQIDPHALDEPAFDCCDRIAELRKLAQPGEREREKSKEKQ